MLVDLPPTDTPDVVVSTDVATGPLAYATGLDASAWLNLDLEGDTRLALHADLD